MMEEKDFIAQIQKINEKVDIDTEFPDWKRSVQFVVKNGEKEKAFYFVTDGTKVSKVDKGKIDKPDITIEGTQEAMSKLFEGKLAIVEAFITKELGINGAIGDAIGANVLIQATRVF